MATIAVAHQERLCGDPDHFGIEVRQQQQRELEPTLVDHMPARRRGPVQPRQMILPAMRANRPPRNRRQHQRCRQLSQRHLARGSVHQAHRSTYRHASNGTPTAGQHRMAVTSSTVAPSARWLPLFDQGDTQSAGGSRSASEPPGDDTLVGGEDPVAVWFARDRRGQALDQLIDDRIKKEGDDGEDIVV